MTSDTKEKLLKYFRDHKEVHFSKGKTILKSGDKPNYIGFIKSGYVRMYLKNESGKEITLHFFKPIFWMTSIFAMTGIENKYYFEALTPVTMYSAPIKETVAFLRNDEELKCELMRIVTESFLDSINQLANLLTVDSYAKVASMAATLSKRSKEEGRLYSKIDFGITHKLIAGLTGLTRETVTLQMLKLEKDGLIDNQKRKVIVLDQKGLTQASNTIGKTKK